jgi:hypothetical protein
MGMGRFAPASLVVPYRRARSFPRVLHVPRSGNPRRRLLVRSKGV